MSVVMCGDEDDDCNFDEKRLIHSSAVELENLVRSNGFNRLTRRSAMQILKKNSTLVQFADLSMLLDYLTNLSSLSSSSESNDGTVKEVQQLFEEISKRSVDNFEAQKRLLGYLYNQSDISIGQDFLVGFLQQHASESLNAVCWHYIGGIIEKMGNIHRYNEIISSILFSYPAKSVIVNVIMKRASDLQPVTVGLLFQKWSDFLLDDHLLIDNYIHQICYLLGKATNDISDFCIWLKKLIDACRWIDPCLYFESVIKLSSLCPSNGCCVLLLTMMEYPLDSAQMECLYVMMRELFLNCSCSSNGTPCVVPIIFDGQLDMSRLVHVFDIELYEVKCKNSNIVKCMNNNIWKQKYTEIIKERNKDNKNPLSLKGDNVVNILQILSGSSLISFIETLPILITILRFDDKRVILKHLCAFSKSKKPQVSLTEKKYDLQLILLQSVFCLYISHHPWDRVCMEDVISSFSNGLQKNGGLSTLYCVKILSVISHEYQVEMSRVISSVIMRFAQIMSTSRIAAGILEFLLFLSDLPQVHCNFVEEDYRRVFGIAIQYIQTASEQKQKPSSETAYFEYVLITAYTTIRAWFHLLRFEREKFFQFISRGLKACVLNVERNELCLELLRHQGEMCKDNCEGDLVAFPTHVLSLSSDVSRDLVICYEHRYGGCFREVFHLSSMKAGESIIDAYKRMKSIKADTEATILDRSEPSCRRALSVLGRTPNVDLHKISVLYVGPYQMTETPILRNEGGSLLYHEFLQNLGKVTEIGRNSKMYLGGLDVTDGLHAITWSTFGFETVFHVSTLMRKTEGTSSNMDSMLSKKRHIGNNYVHIIWDESLIMSFNFDTIPSQFNYAYIHIAPKQHGFEVHLMEKEDSGTHQEKLFFYNIECLARFVRFMSIHMNLLAQIEQQVSKNNLYMSNTAERQRQIKVLFRTSH